VIVCAQCGERSPAGVEFCGVCGTYLEWDGATEEEQSRVLATTQVPSTEQPTVQQPTEQRTPRRPTPVGTELRPPNPGDLICGECGAGNGPARKFCRHCGHSLAEAETLKRAWWRVLISRRRNRKRRLGDRPSNRGGRPWRRVRRWIGRLFLVALAFVGILYAAVPPFRGEVNQQVVAAGNRVKGMFVTRFDPVRPTTVVATATLPDHGANLAADNAKNTFWAAPVAGVEPTLVLSFDRPVDIRRAIVRSGNTADFQSAHRPAKLHLVYSTGRSFDVVLADTPDPQTVDIGESAGATSVEVHIVELHRSLKGDAVAISEIELFEKVS
jgi:ribosomal protein L40E